MDHMLNSPYSRTRSAGFTYLEMAVVLVILGVLVSIALPRYAQAALHQRVNHAANVVAADLELAGALAAQRRVAVELRVIASPPGYAVVTRDSGRIVLRRTLGSQSEWRLQTVAATPRATTFFPGGTLSSPMQLVLGSAGHHRTVTITRAGLVRVLP
jgi:prepilin-type N-terminal cleavage/methylation domain-containing protein